METLRRLGLNLYEAKAYEVLLQGSSTAHTIVKKSAVPSGKIYPVLDSLIHKGFATSHGERPRVFTAVSPEVAFERILQNRKQDLEILRKEARELVDAYSKVKVVPPENIHNIVETYFGHDNAFVRSITLHNQAKTYWKTISRLTLNKEHLDACSKAIRQGVKILAITSPAETTSERVYQWRKRGVKVRFLKELPFRLSVYDDKGVIFRFSHEKSKQYVGTHIQNGTLAKGMSKLFDSFWKSAAKNIP